MSAAFLYFHQIIEVLCKNYAKDMCEKLGPNPLLIFVRDCQQMLPVKQRSPRPLPPSHLFLMDNIKVDKIPTKIKRKMHALFTFYFKF